MNKQISIILFGLVLFIALTQSASISVRRIAHFNSTSIRIKRDFTNEQYQFQQEVLEAHNNYRARHCAGSLEFDYELSVSAQNYAEHLAQIESLVHSGTPGVGENLWQLWSSNTIDSINGYQPVDSWYNEVEQYNYDNGGFSMETGHFTQLVWKNSQRLGVGIAFSYDHRQVFVVAQYSPPGNYEGQYQDNVSPPSC